MADTVKKRNSVPLYSNPVNFYSDLLVVHKTSGAEGVRDYILQGIEALKEQSNNPNSKSQEPAALAQLFQYRELFSKQLKMVTENITDEECNQAMQTISINLPTFEAKTKEIDEALRTIDYSKGWNDSALAMRTAIYHILEKDGKGGELYKIMPNPPSSVEETLKNPDIKTLIRLTGAAAAHVYITHTTVMQEPAIARTASLSEQQTRTVDANPAETKTAPNFPGPFPAQKELVSVGSK